MTVAKTPFTSRSARDGQRDLALLRSFLASYRALGLILGVVVTAIWIAEPSPWILLIASTAFAYAGVLTVARRWSAAGDVRRAVLLVNAVVWPLTVIGAIVAPSHFRCRRSPASSPGSGRWRLPSTASKRRCIRRSNNRSSGLRSSSSPATLSATTNRSKGLRGSAASKQSMQFSEWPPVRRLSFSSRAARHLCGSPQQSRLPARGSGRSGRSGHGGHRHRRPSRDRRRLRNALSQ